MIWFSSQGIEGLTASVGGSKAGIASYVFSAFASMACPLALAANSSRYIPLLLNLSCTRSSAWPVALDQLTLAASEQVVSGDLCCTVLR